MRGRTAIPAADAPLPGAVMPLREAEKMVPPKDTTKSVANDRGHKAKTPCADYCAHMGDHDQTIPI